MRVDPKHQGGHEVVYGVLSASACPTRICRLPEAWWERWAMRRLIPILAGVFFLMAAPPGAAGEERHGHRFAAALRAQAVPAPVTPTGTVAVVPFSNISQQPSDDWIGDGIAETVRGDLQALGLSVLERAVVGAVHEPVAGEIVDEAASVRLGRRLGVRWVVSGGYQRVGDHLRITARFVDVASGAVVRTAKVDGQIDELFALQDRIVAELTMEVDLDGAVPGLVRRPEPAREPPGPDDARQESDAVGQAGQFKRFALYEVGAATTDLGSEEGTSKLVYGFGAGASYGFLPKKDLGIVVGADLVVRGFGLEIPDRLDLDAGVFDQNDLWIDEFVALRFRRIIAGIYFEQRRIGRGRAGTIGFPASGVGFLAEVSGGRRTTARFSYASFSSGHLRVDGVDTEPEVTSGRSVRVSLTYRFTNRWSARGEYAYTAMELEPLPLTLSFFDHRQRSVTTGVVVAF